MVGQDMVPALGLDMVRLVAMAPVEHMLKEVDKVEVAVVDKMAGLGMVLALAMAKLVVMAQVEHMLKEVDKVEVVAVDNTAGLVLALDLVLAKLVDTGLTVEDMLRQAVKAAVAGVGIHRTSI